MPLMTDTADDLLFGQINTANPTLPTPATPSNWYFGVPHMDTDNVTTVAPVTGVLATLYSGYTNIRYKRLNLTTAFGNVLPVVKSLGATSLHRLLPMINSQLGLNFQEKDIIDTNIQSIAGGEAVNLKIQATPQSLGFTGQFILAYFRLKVELVNAIVNTNLTTLVYPNDPTAHKWNIGSAMYNTDFTNDLPSLKLSGNYWQNVTGVQALMNSEFGLTDWPAPAINGVTDYATKDYPSSNQNFDRVIVQKQVNAGTYAGDALFHYNLS